MAAKEILLSEEGKQKLTEELDYLKLVRRKEVAEAIKVAKGFGDLSENSEYDEAKKDQAATETRIAELEEILKNVRVIANGDLSATRVGVGSKVKVKDLGRNAEVEYSIVSSLEADPPARKISDESPIGKALLGHSEGDTVEVQLPAKVLRLEILSISL
ncbi:MAG: transcription elongation factor GreA [Clostridia bacterium]|nr:transcription elongation factor GreA [Clostridia bacterium]